jgi:hypothetical protein
MTALVFSLILDLIVAALLGITIFYCTKLNKRIRILQDSKNELAQLIHQFDESTQMATRSISEIHVVSRKINESIKTKLEKANYIVDDLAFMIEKGNKLADRMESDFSGSRKASPSGRSEAALRAPAPRAAAAEEAEMAALPRRIAQAAAGGETERPRRASAGLESMLEKIAQKKSEASPAAGAVPREAAQGTARKLRANTRLRSKTEQELYDALKSEQ